MPETRKFAQGLKRKGTAPPRRESSQLIRSSVYSDVELVRTAQSEPIDYEAYLLKHQSEFNRDTLCDLLVFPEDDVIATVKKRELRTVADTVPKDALKEASSLMVQECVKNYSSDWQVIEKKYEQYGQDYLSLSRNEADWKISNLPDQVFEVDDEPSIEEDVTSIKGGISKAGWLYKAPDFAVASLSIKSFKRRYCHLKQLSDSSYILNYYRDEKVSKDPKGAIYLDSCLGAHSTTKGRKHAFEIRMQDQNYHIYAAETESDANQWISTINLALQNTLDAQAQQKERFEHEAKQSLNGDGELCSLKSSMHPELIKYAKETDQKNTQQRKKSRFKVFRICPDFQNRFSKNVSKLKKQLNVPPPPALGASKHRIMVNCKSISFTLRGVVIDGQDEPVTNVEPFFVSLSLYDVSAGKKISSDLHVDLNHPLVSNMIPSRNQSRVNRTSGGADDSQYGEPSVHKVDVKWLAHPKRGIFTVSRPHADIYLVVRIEKVLQGSIKSCAPPYMRADADNHKAAAKVLKHAKAACQRLGQYRMPFAWTAKQLFTNEKGHLNVNGFDLIYKQESSKLAEEDLLKFLSDFKRQEKLSKLEFIDCDLQINIDSVPTDLPNIVTSSLVPVRPFEPKASEPVLEVDELASTSTTEQHINMEYTNHCFVYPKALNYDSQKSFAKARNIAVTAEFRDSDTDGATPLCRFYKKPGPPGTGLFCTRGCAAVLHHQEKPEFYEEWKISLPTQLHHGHHLLFTFYHVVVDINAKKKDTLHTEVGQTWLPLLTKDGRVATGEHPLPVATSLPLGYLSTHEQMGRHQEIKWVDGGKPLFKAGISLVSSVYTDDQHIHSFFEACKKFHSGASTDRDIVRNLKSLLACETSPLIRFLPTIFKQLLYLFTAAEFGSDAQAICMKSLVNLIATCHTHGHDKLLQQYTKYMFTTAPWKDCQSKTIHEEIATAITSMLRPSTSDFLTTNKLLLHLSFFLQIIVKSMIQHLINTEKIKLERTERFPVSFRHAVQSLLTSAVPHIVKKWQTNYSEVHSANQSLAVFVRDCFTYMDRGFVFRLINRYCSHFSPGDAKVLFELKFEFLREVCNHEHYIPLNFPFSCSAKGKNSYSYCLTDDFCRYHFLAGILMKNLCTSMYEPKAIRSVAIEIFRNLLAKHAFDDRYQTDCHQSRIAALYLPFLRILLDNVARFSDDPDTNRDTSQIPANESGDSLNAPPRGADSISNSPSIPPPSERAGSLRSSRIPDSSLMSTIANPGSTLLTRAAGGGLVEAGSSNSSPTVSTQKLDKGFGETSKDGTMSIASMTRLVGAEHLDQEEIRSLLLSFLYIVSNLPNDALKGFWKDSTTDEQIDFFEVLMLCLHHFRYIGKKQHFQRIRFGSLSKLNGNMSRSFPARLRTSTAHIYNNMSKFAEPMVTHASHMIDDEELDDLARLEANLSTEVGKIVLDMLAEFTRHYKKQLQSNDGDNLLMKKFFDVLLRFLQINQSEEVVRHVFASLRLVLCKFPNALFRGSADLCASLIYHVLKCCNSSLASTRSEACALLYLLMRNNFQSSLQSRNFVRSHLQMIKAVSQLISKEFSVCSSRFQHSLALINKYAISDKGMQSTRFPTEVKDLTKKLRTVLMATAAMKEHSDDPEKLIDLQCSLAKSYAATPELRKTWLEEMAGLHSSNKNYSEAAMCYIHIAALVAEYLKRKAVVGNQESDMYSGLTPSFVSKLIGGVRTAPQLQDSSGECGAAKGCAAFRGISLNVEREESSIKEDAGMQDVHYSEDILIELLHTCAECLEKAERYELLASVFNMIIPYYEKRRDYEALIRIYSSLKVGYEKVVEVNRNGKRMLGTYFRVGLYGQTFFEDEDGMEYIYKEPKLTQLSEISHRLQAMYGNKFGKENVRLIQESGKVNRKDLDTKLAYIQVTYVLPYFDDHEREQRRNYFEQQQNVKNFVFETPFTLSGRARGDIEDQWKRKTILTTSHYFPYIKKRIPVVTTRSFEMKPIEVALDEMTSKCNELELLIIAEHVDLKKMQLRLQGSVNVQVNAGPLAYARTFLQDDKISKHAANTVEMLRKVYRRFVDICGRALYINQQLITTNQQAYHQSLQQSYVTMAGELSQILHEQLLDNDDDTISVLTTGLEPETSVINSTPKRPVIGSVSDSSVV